MVNFNADEIQEKIDYHFEDAALLRLAFTHSSYANENKTGSNEKLEFLGDSILNFCVADHLFRRGGKDEGQLSQMRADIVSKLPLARAVDKLNIIGYLICGVGEEANNPDKSDSVKADLFEAVTGAIYLDSGDITRAERFVLNHLDFIIGEVIPQHEAAPRRELSFNLPSKRIDNQSDDYRFAADKKMNAGKKRGIGRARKERGGETAATAQAHGGHFAPHSARAPHPFSHRPHDGARAEQSSPQSSTPLTKKELKLQRKAQKQLLKEQKKREKRLGKGGGADARQTAPSHESGRDNFRGNGGVHPNSGVGEAGTGIRTTGIIRAGGGVNRDSAGNNGARRGNGGENGRASGERNAKTDYKGLLQNHAQRNGLGTPDYKETGRSGSDHEPIFKVSVFLDGKSLGEGEGGRKRDAEQAAAGQACRGLGIDKK